MASKRPRESETLIDGVQVPKPKRIRLNITLQQLEECFDLPLEQAAAILGVYITTLIRVSRRFGIPTWPDHHRKRQREQRELATRRDEDLRLACLRAMQTVREAFDLPAPRPTRDCRAGSIGFLLNPVEESRPEAQEKDEDDGVEFFESSPEMMSVFGSTNDRDDMNRFAGVRRPALRLRAIPGPVDSTRDPTDSSAVVEEFVCQSFPREVLWDATCADVLTKCS